MRREDRRDWPRLPPPTGFQPTEQDTRGGAAAALPRRTEEGASSRLPFTVASARSTPSRNLRGMTTRETTEHAVGPRGMAATNVPAAGIDANAYRAGGTKLRVILRGAECPIRLLCHRILR